MDSEELLAQLADIHLPGEVGYWPPAPGWWVLACLLLVAAFILGRRFLQQAKQKRICQYALKELELCLQNYANSDDNNPARAKLKYVNAFNSVLRRVALVHFPESNAASLGGTAWVDFIRESGESTLLNEEISAALSYGRFQTECEVDVSVMDQLGQQWISSLYTPTANQRNITSNLQGSKA